MVICEDARERDLDGGGDPRSECVGEGARDTFEAGDASLGVLFTIVQSG